MASIARRCAAVFAAADASIYALSAGTPTSSRPARSSIADSHSPTNSIGVIFSRQEESPAANATASRVSGVTDSSSAPSPRASATCEKPAFNEILPSGHPPLINGAPSNTSVSGGSVAKGGIVLVSGKRKRGQAPYFGVFLSVEGRPRARLCRLDWRLRCLLADAHNHTRNIPGGFFCSGV